MDTIGRKLGLILIVLSVFTLTVSAANWNFEPSEGAISNVSSNSSWIFSAKLVTDDGDELNPNRLPFYPDDQNGNNYINGTFVNETGTFSDMLTYSSSMETWLMFGEPGNDIQDLIFEAQGVSGPEFQDSNGREVIDFNVSKENHTLELKSEPSSISLSDPYEVASGSYQKISVNVSSDGEFDQDANVSVYFHNHTFKSDTKKLNEVDTGEEIHYDDIKVPEKPNSTYILRITSENQETGDYGSYSTIMKTSPEINLDVTEFSSVGCDSSGLASSCEPEAAISAEAEVSGAEANSVNVSTWLTNSTNSELVRIGNDTLTGSGSTYEGEITMPDINKSKFEDTAVFRFNASNDNSHTTKDLEIDLQSYNLGFAGKNDGFIGSNYRLAFEAEKAYSGKNYNLSRFDEVNGTVSRSGSFELDFTEEDFSYDESSDLIVADFTIPEDASTGIHDIDFNFTDIYNETKSVSDNFRVNEFDQNFEVAEGLEVEVDKLHEVNRSLEVQNNGGASLEINVNLSEEFDGIVNMTDSFSLEPDQTKLVNYTINLTEPEDLEGEINLTESSGYSVEEVFNIDTPNCQIRNESLCADHGEIDFGTVEGNKTEELEMFNLHVPEMELNISAEGNISEHIDYTNSTAFNDSETIPIIFEPSSRGNFTGTLNMVTDTESVSVNLTAVSNITEPGESDLSISPSETTLSLPEGEIGTAEFTVENSGEIEIADVNVELENGEANIDSFDLSSSGTNQIEVEVNQSDTLTLTGQTSSGQVTAEASITVEEMDNYEERASEIEDKVRELRDENNNPSLDGDLTDLELQAENVRTQWNNGNYEEAQQTFNEAQDSLNELETEIQSQQSETGGGIDQNQTDPGDEENEEDSGGLPIIPIVAIIAILLIVGGFIFFESYIPEEGDPLYGVIN